MKQEEEEEDGEMGIFCNVKNETRAVHLNN